MTVSTIADLTIPEFKNLMRETFNEILIELYQDPDEGLELREEFAERLSETIRKLNAGELKTFSGEEVAQELGLEW